MATRIPESGRSVYGLGEQKTPSAFVAACDRFIYTEILRAPTEAKPGTASPVPLQPLLEGALAATARESGWAALSAVGSHITKTNPSFDPRNYGFAKLWELVRNQQSLEVKEVPVSGGSANVHLYIRSRETRHVDV